MRDNLSAIFDKLITDSPEDKILELISNENPLIHESLSKRDDKQIPQLTMRLLQSSPEILEKFISINSESPFLKEIREGISLCLPDLVHSLPKTAEIIEKLFSIKTEPPMLEAPSIHNAILSLIGGLKDTDKLVQLLRIRTGEKERESLLNITILNSPIKKTEMLYVALRLDDPNPSICRWLQIQGADIKDAFNKIGGLEKLTKNQKDIYNWLSTFSDKIELTADSLHKLAIRQGNGYKSANLILSEIMAEKINAQMKCCDVKIPSSLPISDIEVSHHIKKYAPDLFDKWTRFLDSFSKEQKEAYNSQDPSSKQIDITDNGLKILREIEEQITDVFTHHPLNTPVMQNWLKEHQDLLIIRSTGKEDSDELSNAGGNESIPSIKPDIISIAVAMGKVVSSYFGEKSIRQRLMARDLSIFTEPPFVPVLIQSMVMEDVGEKPLVSGVLFCNPQPELSNHCVINAGLGNNHGIVTSQVAVDRYSVLGDSVQKVVSYKPDRFVTCDEGLKKIENDKTIAETQALPTGVINDLAKAASYIASSAVHGAGKTKSMDMEFSVKWVDGKMTIYLLQARPLMGSSEQEKHAPTYLDFDTIRAIRKEHPEDIISGKTLLFGNSWVRTITSKEQIIFAEDLAIALNQYEQSENKKNFAAVVIHITAVLTSHEGVMFRLTGLPVIMIEDSKIFENAKTLALTASKNDPIKISPQNSESFVSTRHL
ncbi:MAG: PEP/pyruvate-binding domain-containing protein, partial [Parachlamydiaceae bacterium]